MENIYSKYDSMLKIDDEKKFGDEFHLEESANQFRETIKSQKLVESRPKPVNENQDVYFDAKTGKIVVNIKKSEKLTGVKRQFDRNDREEDNQDDV